MEGNLWKGESNLEDQERTRIRTWLIEQLPSLEEILEQVIDPEIKKQRENRRRSPSVNFATYEVSDDLRKKLWDFDANDKHAYKMNDIEKSRLLNSLAKYAAGTSEFRQLHKELTKITEGGLNLDIFSKDDCLFLSADIVRTTPDY